MPERERERERERDYEEIVVTEELDERPPRESGRFVGRENGNRGSFVDGRRY